MSKRRLSGARCKNHIEEVFERASSAKKYLIGSRWW